MTEIFMTSKMGFGYTCDLMILNVVLKNVVYKTTTDGVLLLKYLRTADLERFWVVFVI